MRHGGIAGVEILVAKGVSVLKARAVQHIAHGNGSQTKDRSCRYTHLD